MSTGSVSNAAKHPVFSENRPPDFEISSVKANNGHYYFDQGGGFMSPSFIDEPIILTALLGNIDIAGEKYPIIYRQFPVRIIQVNTTEELHMEHLDFSAPRPPLEQFICTVVPRHIGLDIDLDPYHSYFVTKQLPILLYSPPENNFICSVTDTAILHALPEADIERAAGDRSVYGLYMANARAKVQRFFDAGVGMPVPVLGALHRPFMECRALQLTDLEHYRNILRGPQRKDALLDNIAQAADNIREVDAILRVLRRVALDLCAFIGAVELPSWDSLPQLAGVVLYSHKFPKYGGAKLAEIATLERWGVPIWMAERCEQRSRLELDASSRPSSDHLDREKIHQQKLALARATGVNVKDAALYEGKTVVQRPARISPGLFDDDEGDIDSLILRALMPGPGEEGMAFDDFASQLERKMFLTGSVAWSNQQYEAGKHGAIEGRAWNRSRYYPFDTRNAPALCARRMVPPHYHNPTLLIPKQDGSPRQPLPYPAPVPKGTWYGVELRFFDRLSLVGEVKRFHPSIFAYHLARTTAGAVEGGYEEGREKPFILQFWAKDKAELGIAMQSLPRHLQGKRQVDIIPNSPSASLHWVSLVNTQYISLVLASPRPKAIREGLLGVMPKVVQPATGDPQYRPGKVRYNHYLRHFLIGKDRWEPVLCSESYPTRPRFMDRFEFTNEYLRNLVAKPRPISFSLDDHLEFHRVQVVLEMLTGLSSFKVQLLANKGPLSKICCEIAENVELDSSNNVPDCKFTAAGRAEMKEHMELISWTAGRPMLTLFLCPESRDLRSVTESQLLKWEEEEEHFLTTELAKKKHQPSGGASSSKSL
jgi:hypothetical protein